MAKSGALERVEGSGPNLKGIINLQKAAQDGFSHTNASLALAVDRRIKPAAQAGARPMTSFQYLLELQRDWARSVTYDATIGLVKTFGGAYGLGVIYAKSMLGVHASEAGEAP